MVKNKKVQGGVISGGFGVGGQAGYSGNVQISIFNVLGDGFDFLFVVVFGPIPGGRFSMVFGGFGEGGSVGRSGGRSVLLLLGRLLLLLLGRLLLLLLGRLLVPPPPLPPLPPSQKKF